MEIVIESDPLYRPSSTSPAQTTSYLRSPVAPVQPIVSTSSAFYYATLPRGGQQRTEPLDGAATTSVRRVDKSGLLEIAELEPGRQNSSRHIAGADGHATLSRRIERSGLLESVPEIPDQCHRAGLASEELLAAAATTRSMVERQQHLLGAETDIVESALLRRRSLLQELSQDSATSSEACSHTRSSPRVKFAADENLVQSSASLDEMKEPRKSSGNSVVADCLGRLSPRQRDSHTPMTLSNIPDVIEAHGTSATSNAATATTTSTTTGGDAPEGERAEAEGCEHTTIDSLEEARVSYKGTNSTGSATATGNKIAHNDNIQAVHVIILSEQL